MRERLTAWLPDSIIVFMANVTGKSKLTTTEKCVQKEFIVSLGVEPSKSAWPGKIVAIVGLLGSGNSSVARVLANAFPAVVIEGEVVHTLLREAGASQDRAWKISENIAIAVADKGKNVIIDADFVQPEKRKSLLYAAKHKDINVLFVRVTCHVEMINYRIVKASYREGSFFPGANPTSKELKEIWSTLDANTRGMIIKKKEMQRRLLNHYRWQGGTHGGKLMLKKMPFVNFEIDTTDEKKWPEEVKRIVKQIRLR